jgi:hypothetical protein
MALALHFNDMPLIGIPAFLLFAYSDNSAVRIFAAMNHGAQLPHLGRSTTLAKLMPIILNAVNPAKNLLNPDCFRHMRDLFGAVLVSLQYLGRIRASENAQLARKRTLWNGNRSAFSRGADTSLIRCGGFAADTGQIKII